MEKVTREIACWICGVSLIASCVPTAVADTAYTYEFTANPGQVTWYNGTTFKVEVIPGVPGDLPPPNLFFDLVSLDFHGVLDLPAWAGDPPFYGPTPPSLTPFSFSPSGPDLGNDFVEISTANALGWAGSFTGYGGPYFPQDPVSLSYFVSSSEVFFNPDSGGTGQPIMTEFASGTWTVVPDGGSSFELLATIMITLEAGRLLFSVVGIMKIVKLNLAGWIGGLFLVAAFIPSALANTEYTYEFTEKPGQLTGFSGTTIEIEVSPGGPDELPTPDLFYNVVSLDFHGDLYLRADGGTPASSTPFSYSPTGLALSELDNSIAGANSIGWTGSVSGTWFLVTSSDVWFFPDGIPNPQDVINPYIYGTWTRVPDGGSSFELLATAMVALGSGHLFFGKQTN